MHGRMPQYTKNNMCFIDVEINQGVVTWTASDFLAILVVSYTRWTAALRLLSLAPFKPLISLWLSALQDKWMSCLWAYCFAGSRQMAESSRREGGLTKIECEKYRWRAYGTVEAGQHQFDVWDGCSFWDLNENSTIFSVNKALLW